MKRIDPYNWKPDLNNPVQIAFADFLQVYESGVTKAEFTALYAAFLGGMIFSPTLLAVGMTPQKLLDMINVEGKVVTGLMAECNLRFN